MELKFPLLCGAYGVPCGETHGSCHFLVKGRNHCRKRIFKTLEATKDVRIFFVLLDHDVFRTSAGLYPIDQ